MCNSTRVQIRLVPVISVSAVVAGDHIFQHLCCYPDFWSAIKALQVILKRLHHSGAGLVCDLFDVCANKIWLCQFLVHNSPELGTCLVSVSVCEVFGHTCLQVVQTCVVCLVKFSCWLCKRGY